MWCYFVLIILLLVQCSHQQQDLCSQTILDNISRIIDSRLASISGTLNTLVKVQDINNKETLGKITEMSITLENVVDKINSIENIAELIENKSVDMEQISSQGNILQEDMKMTVASLEENIIEAVNNTSVLLQRAVCNPEGDYCEQPKLLSTKTCQGKPSTPRNSTIMCGRNECFAKCHEGYQFAEDVNRLAYHCEDGNWQIQDERWVNQDPDCEPVCNPECKNNGICLEPNVCGCPDNFEGDYCEQPKLPSTKTCQGKHPTPRNSTIMCRRNECFAKCHEGYQFAEDVDRLAYHCEDGNWQIQDERWVNQDPVCEPSCDPTCQNGGRCLAPDVCECTPDFRGEHCQYRPVCVVSEGYFKLPGGEQCFKRYQDVFRSFTDAEAKCKLHNMVLAQPNDNIAADLRRYIVDNYGDDYITWIGAQGDGSVYRYLREQPPLTTDSHLWAADEPEGITSDWCLGLRTRSGELIKKDSNSPYVAYRCSVSYYTLCEVVMT